MKLWHSYDIVSPAIPKINFAAKLRNNYELSIMKGKIVWFLHVILPIVPMFMCRQTGNPWLLLFFFSIKYLFENRFAWFWPIGHSFLTPCEAFFPPSAFSVNFFIIYHLSFIIERSVNIPFEDSPYAGSRIPLKQKWEYPLSTSEYSLDTEASILVTLKCVYEWRWKVLMNYVRTVRISFRTLSA